MRSRPNAPKPKVSPVTASSLDSFKSRKDLQVGNRNYVYYSLPDAAKAGLADIEKLPFSLKVLLENLLRNEDGRTVKRPISRR